MEQYPEIVKGLRQTFLSGKTKNLEWRKTQLQSIIRMLQTERNYFIEALKQDLHKPKFEARGTEIDLSINDCVNCLNHLEEWAKPEKVKKGLLNIGDDCFITPEPFGVSLIIGAWNYPLQLTVLPMIGALSAGNCVLLKPSEVSETTAALLAKVIPQYLDKDAVKVINGAAEETTALLKERYDIIFYTGNSMVAKIVMTAAARHLTPVVLELGGKSPVYVDESSDMQIVANRIVWGKFMNCGQTCIAPDYVMCHPAIQDKLVNNLRKSIKKFYSENPKSSQDLGRMVNQRHFQRVERLLGSGKVAIGGNTDKEQNFIEPTVLINVKPDEPAMQDEIFGPVLPIMTVESMNEAIQFINSREKPLALYMFSKNRASIDKMVNSTSSGTTCINDTVMQGALDTLPFGGVGNSGTGSYHGKFSFDAFSHKRGVMVKQQAMEGANSIRYPPFSDKKLEWMMWLMKKQPKKEGIQVYLPYVILGIIAAYVIKAKL